MCVAVIYNIDHYLTTDYFAQPKASLPVLLKNGGRGVVVWGRRESETGNLPEGAGLFLEDIHRGVWNEFFPKPVKLPLVRFAMRNKANKLLWFELLKEHLVQGVVLCFNSEIRCYIVYIKTHQPTHPAVFWPRILYRGEQLTMLN